VSYKKPSFIELKARINADLAQIPAVLAEPLAGMWARACSSQHAYLDWILAQCSPFTCELERLYDWASLYGVDRLLPVAAQGYVLATGNQGSIVLADSLLRAQNGLNYQVLQAITIGATATPVLVRCTTRGKVSNVAAGQILTLIDPILGVNNSSYIGVNGLSGGEDDELVDAWRLRVADEWRTMVIYGGRSGKPADYKAWSKSAHPSVSGALVQPHALGIGTVLVRPICNDLSDRLPTQTILDAVAAYLPQIAPATADWRVAAPLLHHITILINLSPTVDTAENRQAITDSLSVLINSNLSEQSTLLLTDIDVAIMSITSDYVRIAPTANITAAAGEVFVLNPVVFS
jgi:uncharacterized phage protein gp47/JayE